MYALVDLVPSGPLGHRSPVGHDCSPYNFIVLGNKALTWFDDETVDRRIAKIADATDERLAASAAKTIRNLLTERIDARRTFQHNIVELLRHPPDGRWYPLQPDFLRQSEVIWLGPGGRERNVFYEMPAYVPPHSITYSDNFNRSAADLSGSVFSDGSGCLWTEAATLQWTGANNRAEITDITIDTQSWALTDRDVHSADMFVQATGVLFNEAGSTFMQWGVMARTNVAMTRAFGGFAGHNSGVFFREIWEQSTAANLTSDTGTNSTLQTMRIECSGSSIRLKINGTVILGPVTSVDSPGQVPGDRRGAIYAAVGGIGTCDVAIDDFSTGDLSPSTFAYRLRNVMNPRLFAPGVAR